MDQARLLRKIKKGPKEAYGMNLVNKSRSLNRDIRVIAITSGKGGVGKTNIAANFAYIFSKMGKKVLLLDADTGLANIDVILGVTPKYSLLHVLHGKKDLSEIIVQGPGGVKILPAASGVQEMAELSRGQKLTLLEELDDLNEDIDFMFIDTAAGIAGNVMYFNMVAKEIIVVVSPEPTSLTDAYALIKVLHHGYAARRFMLLVNMVRNSKESEEVYRRLSNATDHFLNLSIDYLGYILCDKSVHEAVKQQSLLLEVFPYSKASRCLFSIAKRLSQKQAEDYESGTIKFFGRTNVNRNK